MNQQPSRFYLIKRLIMYGWFYRYQIILGWLCLGMMSLLMSFIGLLTKPLVNIATQSLHAGERTWLRLMHFSSYIEPWIPIKSLGKQFIEQIPDAFYIGPHKTPILICIFLMGIICSIFIALFQFLAYYITHRASFRILTDLRNQVNKVLIHQRLGYYDQWRPGELMSKIQNDMETMGQALTFMFNQAPRSLVQVIVGFASAAFLAPELTAIVIVLPLFVFPLKKLGKKIKRSSRYTLLMRGEMTDVMHQQFGGIREIIGFRLEKIRQTLFAKANESVFNGLISVSRARAFSKSIVEGGGYLLVFAVISIAVYISLRLGKTFGEFTSFMFLISALIWNPLRTLSRAYNNFQNSIPGVESILAILDHPEPLEDPTSPTAFPCHVEVIDFKNISYCYHNEQPILNDINFKVNRGQVVAIVGATGSGKSTLVDLLPRFRDPNQGQVLFNNIDIKKFSLKDLRDHIALVTQETYLFNTTIKENLLMGNLKCSDNQLWDILGKVHLDQTIKEKLEGLNFVVGERGNRLSGGQRQRLAIARALLKDPPILILDEATSAQDSVTEKNIQDALDVLMSGRTTFIIAHRLATVRHADIVLVLKNGQLIEQGSHEQLQALGGEYATLYETQFTKK